MKKIKVAIRAGHGGADRHNRGSLGYIEADGNLKFAKYLEQCLKTDNRFEVFNIRTRDVTLPLSEGPKRAAAWKADVYLSIHSDAYSKTSSGVSIYESVDLDNEVLAGKIGKGIARAMAIPFRGVRYRESEKYPGEDYYTDIDKAEDLGIPFVFLIERGFHSNPNEEVKLMDEEIVKASAERCHQALIAYFFNEEENFDDEKNINHWAFPYYNDLIKKGMRIDKQAFDTPITRGEVFALLSRAIESFKN